MSYNYKDRLETDRLVTRFLVPGDELLWQSFFEDKEAMRFIITGGITDNAVLSKNWIDRQLWRYSTNRMGFQAIMHKETKEFIGLCGLLVQDVNGQEMLEIGYHFMKKYWGNGYATEAAKLFKNFAFENGIADTVVSLININNVPSQKVAERNGMTRGEQIWWYEQDIYVYSVSRNLSF